jgi:hypothetical protein
LKSGWAIVQSLDNISNAVAVLEYLAHVLHVWKVELGFSPPCFLFSESGTKVNSHSTFPIAEGLTLSTVGSKQD